MGNHNLVSRYFLLAILFFAAACENNENSVGTNDTTEVEQRMPTDTNARVVEPVGKQSCFAYTKNRDTILMRLRVSNQMASGTLTYNLYEKDKNTGRFTGTFRNDTLLATYRFQSEGRRSVRQVIYLQKGNEMVEGFGSMKEQNGKLIFSNPDDIVFHGNIVLERVDCDSLLSN